MFNFKKTIFIFSMIMVFIMIANAYACTNPSGVEGEIIYNDEYSIPQYCDGINWIAMAGGDPNKVDTSVIEGPTTGLVAYYRLEETSGSSVLDSSGNENHGTVVGDAELNVNGLIGGGFQTKTGLAGQGDDGRVEASGVFPTGVNQPFTISLWYNREAQRRSIFAVGDQSTKEIILHDGKIYMNISGASDIAKLVPDDPFDQWVHLTVTYDGTDVRAYKNSILTITAARAITITDDRILFGAVRGSNGDGGASFDDVRIYDRAITPLEVAELYDLGVKKTEVVPSGLVGHWRLDETSGTTAYDSSGNVNDAIIINSGSAIYNQNGVVDKFIKTSTTDQNTALRFQADGVFPTGANQPFSVALWFNRDSIASSFFKNSDPADTTPELRLERNFRVSSSLFGFSDIIGQELYNQWVHITLVYDGSDFIIHQNAEYVGQFSQSFSPTDDTFLFGATLGTDGQGYDMDDVRLYNRALTSNEIVEIYNATSGIKYNSTTRTPEYFNGSRDESMVAEWPEVGDGLVGHWKLDETTGATAIDSSGNGNDGTMQNGQNAVNNSALGAVSTSIDFSGPNFDEYIDAGSDSSLDDIFDGGGTLTAWIFADSSNGSGSRIFHKGDSGGSRGFDFEIDTPSGGVLRLSQGFSTTYGEWSTPFNTSNYGSWHHVAVTYDSSSATNDPILYVNGVATSVTEASAPVGTYETDSADNFAIGAKTTDERHFDGRIDDARAYNRALSADEITKLYQMGTPLGQTTSLPQGCTNIGDVCDDGTVYVGLSPDGNVEMYTTTTDTATGLTFTNSGNSGLVNSGTIDVNAGDANTFTLVSTDSDLGTAGFQSFAIAKHCYDLVSNGANDWYMPAREELLLAWENLVDVDADDDRDTPNATDNNYNFATDIYYTSTVNGSGDVQQVDMTDGSITSGAQTNTRDVRCVRKGPAPRCANPYGLEGQMTYNTTHDVVQYCDGARWVGIGKAP